MGAAAAILSVMEAFLGSSIGCDTQCVSAAAISTILGINCVPCLCWSEIPILCFTNFESTEYHLSTAYLTSYGRQFKDPCDLRTCFCNPETTRAVPMRDLTSIVKEAETRAACCGVCERHVIKLFSNSNAAGPWAFGSSTGENAVTIHTLPGEADKIYLTLLPLTHVANKMSLGRRL
jgi:hypothetical protein